MSIVHNLGKDPKIFQEVMCRGGAIGSFQRPAQPEVNPSEKLPPEKPEKKS